jgi:hypothetical protein
MSGSNNLPESPAACGAFLWAQNGAAMNMPPRYSV